MLNFCEPLSYDTVMCAMQGLQMPEFAGSTFLIEQPFEPSMLGAMRELKFQASNSPAANIFVSADESVKIAQDAKELHVLAENACDTFSLKVMMPPAHDHDSN